MLRGTPRRPPGDAQIPSCVSPAPPGGCQPSAPDPPVCCVFPRAEAASRGSPGVPERPPPPSAAGWAEFLNASGGARGEGGAVALLTLSDQEQHELYEAARLVQGAFRKYRVCDRPPTQLLAPQNPPGGHC